MRAGLGRLELPVIVSVPSDLSVNSVVGGSVCKILQRREPMSTAPWSRSKLRQRKDNARCAAQNGQAVRRISATDGRRVISGRLHPFHKFA
jgi:hypothetical protein